MFTSIGYLQLSIIWKDKYPTFQIFKKVFSQFSHSYDFKIEKPDVLDNTVVLVKDGNDINFDQINVEVIFY